MVDKKYWDIVNNMTLEEKVVLTSGANFWNTEGIPHLDIPSIMLTDGPHGLRKQGGKADHLGLNKSIPATAFPTAATLANSWDKDLLYRVGRALGKEASYENVSVLLGPGLNIKRNPLAGRNFEYFSEDPYLSGELASKMVQGIQSMGVSACAKHFAVNSQEIRRMNIDEIVDFRALHEIYLEGFRMVCEEGQVQSIMTSYNKVNGTFANENEYLLKDVLKNKWGFKGLVVTDWGGNNDRVKALVAGNHLEMPSTNRMTNKDIVQAIQQGELAEEILDERIVEYLSFLDMNQKQKQTVSTLDYTKQHVIAKEAALDSIVLLKNENNVLPLNEKDSIAIIGEFAKIPRYQGAGSSLINPTQVSALWDCFTKVHPNVSYAQGYPRFGTKNKRLLDRAIKVSKTVDKIVLFLGLDESSEAEGIDRTHLRLPKPQLELVEELVKLNKDIIVVLASGSPVELPFIENVKGIVHGYLPGQAGGEALFDILMGVHNPSGKLAETYPIKYADVSSKNYFPGIEVTSEHREGIFVGYRYFNSLDIPVNYPFGYGLSYTQFEYVDLKVSDTHVQVTLKNTGEKTGKEVVQVYIHKPNSQLVRANQELKGFTKVELEPMEERTIEIPLSKHAFSYFNREKMEWDTEDGEYEISVGSSSRNIHLTQSIDIVGSTHVVDVYNDKYKEIDIHNITSSDFEEIIGYSLPKSTWDRKAPLDENSIIEQGRYKSRTGLFINSTIDKLSDFYIWRGKPIAGNNVRFAQNMPFRGVARMSNGMVKMEAMDGLILMFNGRFFKGLGKFLKHYFRK